MAEDRVIQGGEWFCSKHQEAAKLFCKDHSRAVCMTCALVDHKPCTLRDLGDVIQEKRETLLTLRDKLVNPQRPDYTQKIHECRHKVDKHFMSVKSAVDVDFAETAKRQLDNDIEDGAIINKEIDLRNEKLYDNIRRIKLEIDKNEEERERRHQEIKMLSDDKRSAIRKQQDELITAIQTIANEIGENISAFERSLQEQTRDEEETRRVLDTTLEGNDETVVRETERIDASVTGVLGKHSNDDTLVQISCRAFNVNYIEGEGIGLGRIVEIGSIEHVEDEIRGVLVTTLDGNDETVVRETEQMEASMTDVLGEHIEGEGIGHGRIMDVGFLEHVEEWKCVSSIKVTHQMKQPTIVGYMNNGKVIITDWGQGSRDTYTLNPSTKQVQKVISASDASYVVSCAMLTNGRVACGRYVDGPPSDSLPGCIIVYDTNHCDASEYPWKELKSIDIRIGTMRHQPANVYVATTPDGRIIAIEDGQRNIYFINPETRGTEKTIKGMDTMVLRGVQSSGYIVAQASPAGRKLYIVEDEGSEEQFTTPDVILNASVVPETNDIYTVSMLRSEKVCLTYTIWNLNAGGENPTDKVDITLCDRFKGLGNSQKHIKTRKAHILNSRVIFVTPTEMIVSDGESILHYRKS